MSRKKSNRPKPGPRTPDGKAVPRVNDITHGVTAKNVGVIILHWTRSAPASSSAPTSKSRSSNSRSLDLANGELTRPSREYQRITGLLLDVRRQCLPAGPVEQSETPVQNEPIEAAPPPAPVQNEPVEATPPPAPVQNEPIEAAPPPAPVQNEPIEATPPPAPVQNEPIKAAPPPAPVQNEPIEAIAAREEVAKPPAHYNIAGFNLLKPPRASASVA